VIVVIGEDGATSTAEPGVEEDVAAPAASPDLVRGRGSEERVRATPLVRRLAQEAGLDLESLRGTGPQGRVTEEDVRRAAVSPDLVPRHGSEGRRERLRGVRRLIAEHMARAHAEIPAVTWVEECDFGQVDLDGIVATVVKACALGLTEFPELNARLEGDEIVYLDRYDIGVAVQTEQGLVVPVVRGCDAKSVEEIDADVRRLADGAREGTLTPDEVRGSTFTVTSAGKLAGLVQTPIVNHPEVAILSVGRIAERPVVRDGDVVIRPIGNVAITFDHRVVDGARAAEFGLSVIRALEGR
jgi:pyruvate dehydrogenase E2 component (dihydrolipoamide acetyltransferase)